jgi:hypothetical protein
MTIRQNILLSTIVFAFALSAGCDQPPKDVTTDPAFGNFESVVGTWKTKVPLRLVEIRKQLYLFYGPGTVTQASREFPAVPSGTEIRIEHLIFRQTFEVNLLDVWGTFANGPYSGKTMHIACVSASEMTCCPARWRAATACGLACCKFCDASAGAKAGVSLGPDLNPVHSVHPVKKTFVFSPEERGNVPCDSPRIVAAYNFLKCSVSTSILPFWLCCRPFGPFCLSRHPVRHGSERRRINSA